uniref:DUF6249 domain-containing protein n=1 Tax=Hoylesella pleuritidis TaxID=407975 RepID=UPI000469D560|nr:DUF6249 domain-containing protein [Hoylesella pleuritidis]
MKKSLIALALMLTFSALAINAVPKHRHHPQKTAVTTMADSSSTGIEAYSDSTALAETEHDIGFEQEDERDYNPNYSDDSDNPIEYWGDHVGWNFGGTLLAIVIVVMIFLFLMSPVIIILFIIRYLIKRHNDRVILAQKAMETGQPVPADVAPSPKRTNEDLWRKGINNAAIGVGLMLMFWWMGTKEIAGVGALVLCMGIGQMFIARTSGRKRDHDEF